MAVSNQEAIVRINETVYNAPIRFAVKCDRPDPDLEIPDY